MMTEKEQDIKRQKGIVQIICTVISFICFLIVFKFIVIDSINPHYAEGLILIIPTVIFAVLAFCVRSNIIKSWIADMLTFLLVIASIFFSGMIIIWITFFTAFEEEVTDINKYDRVLKVISNDEYFPENIPQEAEEIKLYYTPQILQGAEQCFLKFNIDSDYINSEIEKASEECKWSGYILEDYSGESEYESYGLFSEPFSLVGYGNLEYDRLDYPYSVDIINDENNLEVYVIDSKPYEENNWNHGYTYGIAADRKENAIIYFEKKW